MIQPFNLIMASEIDISSASLLLLLLKLTLLWLVVLVMWRMHSRHAAALRHAIAGFGVLVTPFLLAGHFLIPAWSFSLPMLGAIQTPVDMPEEFFGGGNALLEQRGIAPMESANNITLPTRRQTQLSPIDHATSDSTANGETAAPIPAVKSLTGNTASFRVLLVAFWLAGAIWFLGRLCLAWLVMVFRASRATRLEPRQLRELGVPATLIKTLSQQHVQARISSRANQMPLGLGLFSRTILLPTACHTWTAFEWRSVLLHEMAHFQRGDCWLNLVARVQQSIFWFHPLTTILVRMIRNESELACDDRVIETGLSHVDYADVLFQMASRNRCSHFATLASVTMSDTVPLESRIESILNARTPRQRPRLRTLAGVTFMIGVVMVPVATARMLQPSVMAAEARETQEYEEDLALFNVLLKPNKGDTTYGGELVGVAETPLKIKNASGTTALAFHEIRSIRAVPDSDEYDVVKANGEKIQGLIVNDTIDFALDQASEEFGMSRTIDPSQIKMAVQVTHANLEAGKITDGVATSKLSYHLRAPEDYDPAKTWPALVLLHANGSNTKAYVNWIVEQWPNVAKRFVLIGINGETLRYGADPKDPSYFYTGLSFVGRGSNFRGYPGTDRESPAPISEAIQELRERFQFKSLYAIGHGTGNFTSGGNNAYHLHTYFPEVVDGVIVVDGAVLVQCNIEEFVDEDLRRQQRETPLLILDSQGGRYSDWAYKTYMNTSFPMLSHVKHGAGTNFRDMPIDKAIAWLEQISAAAPEEAIGFAEKFLAAGNLRDAIVVMNRVDDASLTSNLRQRSDVVRRSIEKGAAPAARFLECIQDNTANDWIDDFLEFRKTYEFAPAAGECMKAFNQLRQEQYEAARALNKEAQKLKREGEEAKSSEKYQQIVDRYYASQYYLRQIGVELTCHEVTCILFDLSERPHDTTNRKRIGNC